MVRVLGDSWFTDHHLAVFPPDRKVEGALWGLSQGNESHSWGSTPMTSSPPRGPPNTTLLGVRCQPQDLGDVVYSTLALGPMVLSGWVWAMHCLGPGP